MSFTWLPFDFFKDVYKSAAEMWSVAREIGTLMGQGFYELFLLPFTYWQVSLGVIAFWIVSIIILETTGETRKGMLYPAFRYQVWAISGFVVACAPAFFLVHAVQYLSDPDYRRNHQEGKEQKAAEFHVAGSAFITLFVGVHLVFGLVSKNMPPEVENVRFVSESGQVCHAYMRFYKDFKTKEETPYIGHSTCEKPNRSLAGKVGRK